MENNNIDITGCICFIMKLLNHNGDADVADILTWDDCFDNRDADLYS